MSRDRATCVLRRGIGAFGDDGGRSDLCACDGSSSYSRGGCRSCAVANHARIRGRIDRDGRRVF